MFIPFEVIAKWPTPNNVSPETHNPVMVVIIIFLMICVTVLMGIRLYTRQVISNGAGLDDVLILLAFIPAIAFAIIGVIGVLNLGWDRHVWDVRPALITASLQLSLVVQILFDIATSLTKLSMLALIYRVVRAGLSTMRYFIVFFACIVGLNCLLFVFITLFQCSPISDYWKVSLTPQKCLNQASHLLAASIINTITDFMTVFLPIKTVLGLHLPKRQRLIICLLFSGGIVASIAGAVRTYFSWLCASTPDHDTTWMAYYVTLTSSVELFLGIICASLPATKPFFSRYGPRLIGLSTGSQAAEPLAAEAGKSSSDTDFTVTVRHHDAAWLLPEKSAQSPNPVSPMSAPDLNKPLPQIRTGAPRPFSWEV
ncbi:hypothetical protein QBC33DRAFT_557930 [Phialemonium atrogriseum]|uniref:Rhodopsin domain-containing protein n=1 Tax=Phialemonium atrogriseum TaxID=1093897 RepID=A0AAJ0C1L8_9PEZI|nr:uncharacterized protein QBC33DRAFT_557930 [Phialemonium atrogriseum]KAK1768473.1 hypothetical protein QBC33DRAFT_557930 [Phialemonium atrogriseum]